MENQKAIHVVYLITKLELGGAQKICLELFDGLGPYGVKTTLITGATGDLIEKATPLRTIFLPTLKRELSLFGFMHEVRTFLHLIVLFKTLKNEHRQLIVHTHSSKAGILGRFAALFAGIAIRVHTIHGYAFHTYQHPIVWLITYMIELMASQVTTHFICVSLADAQIGKRLFPGFSKRHSLIRAAVNFQQFSHISVCAPAILTNVKNPFVFGTIACFKPQKNLLDLLCAFKILYKQFQYARLEIIGDGIMRTQLMDWINKNNMQHVVTLHGWQKNVISFMQRWHAFALSSLWEGLPCAVVEARLLKLPIVSYRTGGIPEIIKDGHNGFLCEPKDYTTLAVQMAKLMTDSDLYVRMRTYVDILGDFQMEYMLDQHYALYRRLAHTKEQ